MTIASVLRPAALLACALALASTTFAQPAEAPKVTFPAASPASTLKQRVGLTDIEVVYSRPSVKGRTIFGGLEAYGKIWRTGANNATKLTVSTPVKLNGTDIPAGTYELFTIPGETEWTVIIHKDSSQWGAYKYDAKNDIARFTATPVKLTEVVETFTIDVNDIRNESATLNLRWERTRVPIKLTVDTASLVVPQIEAALASPAKKSSGFYFNAAQFYFDQGLDLTKAKAFITEATAGDKPAFYMVHLKAKILAKLGEKADAIAAAKQSSELAVAVEGPQSGFVKMNNDLIASLK
ncbi:hypothetical protein CMV30_08625 [Nibricoccus aquaticus]|uniref:Dihydrolipoamide dehydrogenase n=1 Tax=Nibricoccus aquaticus TaxID=2576891 RepID=A0A290QCN6_9BACT|nr:DUF2911 domain-containing protein [Nibricoccus aquaticus]ATC64006.1 hypothetical protein CMV30_08625 [Nibricoccus aquaticus]